ncbi:Futalosine hydrolase [uncultured archaeon]|nr:Futalosine hydrolase [uncultured archaeon]
MNLALIAPMPVESEELRRRLSPQPKEELKVIFEGELYGKPVIFTHCGVGKVNAAHSTTLMLENYSVDILVLFGIGGGYSGEAGDIVVAESESYGEEGVLTKEGWKSMEFIGFPLLEDERGYYNTFPMDTNLIQRAINALKDAGFNVSSGNFVTVSQCSGTREAGEIMKRRFNGICENMEGAAVAHICTMYRVPMIEIRGISNIIEDRDMKKWNIKKAASNCNEAVIELIKRLK